MYWEGNYDQNCGFLDERNPKAKKEHTCCECKEKISIGTEYLYIVGLWRDERNYRRYFKAYKMCLNCDADWRKVLAIFHDNGKEDACIVYTLLEEAVEDAFDEGFIASDDPLIKKWLPSVYNSITEPETDVWKEIEADAVRTGLQPSLPGL